MPFQSRKLAAALGLQGDLIGQAAQLISGIYKTWWECDASLVEINPLCVTAGRDGRLTMLAVDAKLSLDDNALYRHPALQAMRDLAEEAPLEIEAGKFNPGQKLNAIFMGASILVMLVTGAMLQWFRFFSVPWRSGATFVHDLFAYAIFFVVVGHIVMALTHRDTLRSIFKGWVSRSWAERHAARWLREEQPDLTEL